MRIVDDIFTLLTLLDENLKLRSLPCYVTDSPDAIPSGRLYEGDLSVLMKFFKKMESEIKELKLALASMTNVYNRAETQVKGSYQPTADSVSVINKPAQSADVQLLSADVMNERRSLPQRVWADEYTTDSSSCVDQIEPVDPNDWQPGRSRKSKRRRVRSDQNSNAIGSLPPNLLADVLVSGDYSSETVNVAAVQSSTTARSSSLQRQVVVPMNSAAESAAVDRPSYTAVVQSQPQPQPQRVARQQQQPQRRKQVSVIGRSRNTATSRVGNSSHIAAAKPYISKATFCIDNVSTGVSELAMAQFVAAMDIDVLGCYNVKPRRSAYQRSHGIEPKDRKAFRLCIPREDTARLMDPKKWPVISLFRSGYLRRFQRSLMMFVSVTSDAHQVAGHSASSRYNGSNTAGDAIATTSSVYTTGAINAASNVETHQSTPSGVELLPTDGNTDMDDTIIMDSNDQ